MSCSHIINFQYLYVIKGVSIVRCDKCYAVLLVSTSPESPVQVWLLNDGRHNYLIATPIMIPCQVHIMENRGFKKWAGLEIRGC